MKEIDLPIGSDFEMDLGLRFPMLTVKETGFRSDFGFRSLRGFAKPKRWDFPMEKGLRFLRLMAIETGFQTAIEKRRCWAIGTDFGLVKDFHSHL